MNKLLDRHRFSSQERFQCIRLASWKKRFKYLQQNVEKITPRMLSKELKELEVNGIVKWKVYHQTPVLIEYELTASGRSFANVIDAMIDWGLEHRKEVMETD